MEVSEIKPILTANMGRIYSPTGVDIIVLPMDYYIMKGTFGCLLHYFKKKISFCVLICLYMI